MEFRTIKEDGQVQEEIKNPALSVMPSVFIAKKRLVTSITTIKKNTTKLRITALPSLLGNVVKSNVQVMMVSPVGYRWRSHAWGTRKSQPHQCLYGSDTLLWWH